MQEQPAKAASETQKVRVPTMALLREPACGPQIAPIFVDEQVVLLESRTSQTPVSRPLCLRKFQKNLDNIIESKP